LKSNIRQIEQLGKSNIRQPTRNLFLLYFCYFITIT